MVELNQNKNLKQLNRADAVRKVYFTLEINESTINKTLSTCSTKTLFLLRYKKIVKKAVKVGGFSSHISRA